MQTPQANPPAPKNRGVGPLFWVGLALLILLAALAAYIILNGGLPFGPQSFNGQELQSAEPLPEVTLITYCPDACPTTMAQLKKVPAALGDKADQVQVAMISVDPQRDTPEVLRDYLAAFHPSFIGLTGTLEEITAAAAPFGIYFAAHAGTAATGYLVDHTSAVTAIDKAGHIRLVYPHGTLAEDIVADVRQLVRE